MARRKQQPGASRLVKFFVRSGRLKSEARRGWVKKMGLSDAESVADHSYRTALMTMVFSDYRKLDTGKALRFAILHDLPEAITGDSMPGERSAPSKIALETNAMDRLLRDLPPGLRTLYQDAWEEYVEGKTEEARLVRQLDKLEMAIQAREYAKKLGDPTLAKDFFATAKAHVSDDGLRELLRQVEL